MIGLSAGLTVAQKDNLLFSQLFSHSEFSSKGNLIKVKNEKKKPFTAFGHKVNLWI